jgi:hypothetical protein
VKVKGAKLRLGKVRALKNSPKLMVRGWRGGGTSGIKPAKVDGHGVIADVRLSVGVRCGHSEKLNIVPMGEITKISATHRVGGHKDEIGDRRA